jgi:hypothetical protein
MIKKSFSQKLNKFIMILFLALFLITGCGEEAESILDDGLPKVKTEYKLLETASIDGTKISINSVKKVLNECTFEYEGECMGYTEPTYDYFLLIDLTVENESFEDLPISSMMSFSLKTSNGDQGEYAFLFKSVKTQLDAKIVPGDSLTGQIAYDVKESETYYFYYQDALLNNAIKFVINASDIDE